MLREGFQEWEFTDCEVKTLACISEGEREEASYSGNRKLPSSAKKLAWNDFTVLVIVMTMGGRTDTSLTLD